MLNVSGVLRPRPTPCLRRSLIVAALVYLSMNILALADTPTAHDFQIGPQALASALVEYSKQADVQVLGATDVIQTLRTPGVVGHFTEEQALEQLLRGTELGFRWTGQHTVTIAPRSSLQPASSSNGRADTRLPERPESSPDAGQGGPAITDGDRASRSNLNEIVVTAQKREERLIDIPISIVALTSEELEERNIVGLDDLAAAVPGLSINSQGSYNRRIFLRGIANESGSSLIGMYLDEADVTSGAFTQLDLRTYDLERVEVLRGPQGTLYGDGSAGGTIRFITKSPQLDHFAMAADVAALFTEDGAPSQRIEAMVNAPLIDNVLGLRIVGTFDHEGGWINQPAANQKDINSQNLSDVRVKALWQPTGELTVNAMALIHRNDAGINYGEDAQGNYTQLFNLTTTPTAQDNYDLYNATVSYDFPMARILSTSTYLKQDQEQRNLSTTFQVTPPGTPPYEAYIPFSFYDNKSINEELRLTSRGNGPWQWTVGGFYRSFQLDANQPDFYYGLAGPPGTPLPAPFQNASNTSSKSWAAFGDLSYKIADRFTLGAGVREFEDHQNYVIPPSPAEQTGSFHSISPRAYADYAVMEGINVYASAAKGFRSGGFNSIGQPTYGPETIWTYEFGTKTSFLAGRLTANIDVFYSHYTNYQIFGVLAPPSLPIDVTSNGGTALVKGIEWDVAWHPLEQWTLSVNGDVADAYFTKINVTSSAYNVGDHLDYFPPYAFTVSAQRDFKWMGKKGFARLDFNEQARETYRNLSLGPWYYGESDVLHMLNFNAKIQCNDNLSLGVFAQNLLNDRGLIQPYSTASTVTESDVEARSRPLTVGVDFGVKF